MLFYNVFFEKSQDYLLLTIFFVHSGAGRADFTAGMGIANIRGKSTNPERTA
jgi:hypothetical protein